MRQRHIETFFAVMTYGTVTQAAQRLGVTQPSVTITLRQAETEAGFQLFLRKGGRLEPTAEARILYEEVARAQASLSAVSALCARLRRGEAGELRVASVQSLTETILPQAVRAFTQAHSDAHLALQAKPSREILDHLEGGREDFDIGLIYGGADERGVYTVELDETAIMCVAPADWRLQFDDGVMSFHAMKSRPMIGLSEMEPVGRAVRVYLSKHDVRPETSITAHNHLFAARLAAMGLGYALVDELTARRIRRMAPSQVEIADLVEAPSVMIAAVMAHAGKLNRVTRQFLDRVTQAITEQKTMV